MRKQWRCFFCDELFTREVDAREHFGGNQGSLTGCQIKGYENNLLQKIREQEAELVRHRAEDTDLIRALESLRCEASERVCRAEEIGYGRGVRDMKAMAEKQFGAEVSV